MVLPSYLVLETCPDLDLLPYLSLFSWLFFETQKGLFDILYLAAILDFFFAVVWIGSGGSFESVVASLLGGDCGIVVGLEVTVNLLLIIAANSWCV